MVVSIAVIILTFAALEWREERGLKRARARRRWERPGAAPPGDSCGNSVRRLQLAASAPPRRQRSIRMQRAKPHLFG